MTSIPELVLEIKKKGGCLWVEDRRLHYAAPPNVVNDEAISRLREDRSDVLELLGHCETLCVRSGEDANQGIEAPPELSSAQEAYLVRARRTPEMYRHQAHAVRVLGALDTDAFRRTVTAVARAHRLLRWRIGWHNDLPSIRVAEVEDYELEMLDVSGNSDEEVKALVRNMVHASIDVTRDRLFRVVLLFRSPNEHILYVQTHHFITDAASIEILFEELWSTYARLTRSGPPRRIENTSDFESYCRWLKRNAHAIVQRSEQYWTERLTAARAWHWPVEPDVSRAPEFTMVRTSVSIGSSLTMRINALAEAQRVTPAMILLAAYALVAAKASGQADLVIPTVFSGRNFPQFRRTIGDIAQLSFLRLAVEHTWRYTDLFKAVAREFNHAWNHMDYGLVLSKHPNTQALAKSPFFEWTPWYPEYSCGGRQPSEWSKLELPLRTETYQIKDPTSSSLPSVLYCYPTPSEIRGYMVYRADLFSRELIQSLLDDLVRTCRDMVRQPSAIALGSSEFRCVSNE